MSLQPYPEYVVSDLQWLDSVPSDWAVARLNQSFEIQRRPVQASDSTVTAFRDGQVTLRSKRRLDGFTEADKEIGYQGVRRGDLVIHQMDAFAGAIGVSDSNGKSTPVYSVCAPIGDASSFYFAYLLRHLSRTGYIEALAKGIRERSTDFRWATAKQLLLPLPPTNIQRSIVKFLDRETAEIDAFIADQEELIALLTERRSATISHAVTKGLDPSAPMKDSGVEWIGDFPSDWDIRKIRALFGLIGSGTTPARDNQSYFGGSTPWVTTSELRESLITDTKEKVTDVALRDYSALKVFPAGSLLLAMYGATVGRLGVLGVPATMNQACCAFADPISFGTRFAYYVLGAAKHQLLLLADGGGNQISVRKSFGSFVCRSRVEVSRPP